MKIKNLFLASLAVAAMTACSNNDEFVDNSNQIPSGEQASMRISFSVPTNTTVRATTVENGGKDEGSVEESAITTATIVLDYGGSQRIIKDNLTLSGSADADKVLVASTPKFEVTSGSNITIYAFINPSAVLNKAIAEANDLNELTIGEQSLPLENFLVGNIAKANEFLMSGKKTGITITAGVDTNEAIIDVSRVSAKIEEKTQTNPFELKAPTVGVNGGEKLAVAIIGHSYTNLVKDSYVLSQTNNWTSGSPYLQSYKSGNYQWITSNITYCLENKVGGVWESAKNTATNVQYKGQVYFDNTKAETFYVKTSYNDEGEVKTIYKTWEEMKAHFGGLSDTEGDANYLKANEIVKYTDGICYYEAPIQHTGSGCTIVRNNWYQLTVSKIDDLGWSTDVPPTPGEATKLTVKANIQPWTIHINDIEL